MKKFFRILFFVFASLFAVACSSSSSDETETNISEQSDSDGEKSEHQSEDAGGTADVKFENKSLYSVSVYLSNPKYNSNLVVFAEVEAAASAEKKFTGDIDGATTFYFVYNLNNLGSAAYPYIPYDTISDHKTQKLSKDEKTTVIIDDIEDFKTDSAFLILQNDTTSSVYLVCGNSPLNPYGMDEKEIQYGKCAFYEIGGSGKGAISFEKASELRAVINSSEYRELPKINYEAGKVYTVTVSKTAVERTNTTFFPSSGSVYEVAFVNPKNPLQNRVASFEEDTELSAEDLAALSVDGYDFVGWYIGDKKIEEGFKINQNYTFTAKFEAIDYTINYELNGGKNSSENPLSYTIESDSFSFAAPTRTGYKFSGWYETEDFAGSSTAGIESGNFGDKTLYAKWNLIYKISYELNGGKNVIENPTSYTIDSDSIILLSPSRVGCTFAGWYVSDDFKENPVTKIPSGSFGNITLYAKWDSIIYTAKTLASLNLSKISGVYTLKIAGDITSDTILALASKIEKASADITLDLSEATGLTEIKRFGSNGTHDSDFVNCKTLKSVILPNCLETLGDETFYGCKSLVSVTLPNGLTTIENGVFMGCENLRAITIPNSVTSIGHMAFYGCKRLASVTIPASVTKIGSEAFEYCESIESVILPNGLTTIENGVFVGCENLRSITIPNSVTSIGYMAFYRCKWLTSITIPASVEKIGTMSFQYCEKLQSITFEDTTTWYYCGSSLYKNGTQISVDSPVANVRYFTSTYVDKYWYKE
ncbi:MAG: leucine-rich repeat protein [Treponema sp.]|nr:leucine-rich repeat protein [Treponema sp.]